MLRATLVSHLKKVSFWAYLHEPLGGGFTDQNAQKFQFVILRDNASYLYFELLRIHHVVRLW
mgnify:CR=1 FL=1